MCRRLEHSKVAMTMPSVSDFIWHQIPNGQSKIDQIKILKNVGVLKNIFNLIKPLTYVIT